MTPPPTRNPLDPSRTPGGSSNGSAAAVGAGHVSVATGTQTAGSIIRPASYCGVVGFKPSPGVLPREGVKLLSPTLDTAGLLGTTVADVVEVASAVAANGLGRQRRTGSADAPSTPPRLAFVATPLWDEVDADAQAAIAAAVDTAARAGARIEPLSCDDAYRELVAAQTTIQLRESARSLAGELVHSPELLSPQLRALLKEGNAIPPERYRAALGQVGARGPELVAMLAGYDGCLAPSATGVAPPGLAFTGSPQFCRAWTLIGAPCVSLPLAWTTSGLPAGVQLVGAPGTDGRLLATAAWLTATAAPVSVRRGLVRQ